MNRHRDWLDQAKRDLGWARLDIRYEYWEWACFTAQQAAEKAVRALLMVRGDSVWGLAITPMLRQLADPDGPAELITYAQLLDTYYIPTGYPNGFAEGKPADYYNEGNAQEALHAAEALVWFCDDHID